jgi:hypothetical protein
LQQDDIHSTMSEDALITLSDETSS